MNEVAKIESGAGLNLSTAAVAVPELFVINLCASMTPMPAVPKNLKGFEKYKLYQVSRQEDGRRRFRLRLGFFTSEADAEWVLNSVRSLYPAAFTGCVATEDLRYTGETVPNSRTTALATPAAQPPSPRAERPAVVQTTHIATPTAPAKTTPANAKTSGAVTAPTANKPAPAATPAKPTTLTANTPAATPQQTPASQSHAQPFHVGRGVDIPDVNLELTDEYEIPPPLATHSKTPAATPVGPVAAATAPVTAARPANNAQRSEGLIRSASIIAPPKVVDDYVPILDTTLTIRTLTKTEAEDPNRPKWFAVQLAMSDQPINLDTMPKLDIFAAYTLYCVATMEGATIKHALRLGFFREGVSAEAVMGYLKAFFSSPTINQISSAEFERFSESKPKPRPIAEPESKVIELDTKRPAASVRQSAPAIPQPAKPAKQPAHGNKVGNTRVTAQRSQSFLSRLIGRQLD